ncbi:MAG: HAD-IG family 5'-nucleotidase [Bdellovibrionales bacterium]|nr:HAD-IG family 5'-nucleotidase [Bdellovibrionales bacterium]
MSKIQKTVFINRTLNLKKIKYVGFDMDLTLVQYNTYNFEQLAHKIMLKKLVTNFKYPKSIQKLPFKFSQSIRGLVIDKKKGNLLKLSKYGEIRQAYHGLKTMPYAEQKNTYKQTYIHLSDSRYDSVDTTFSIAFASLYSQLVDKKTYGKIKNKMPSYEKIAKDLSFSLDQAHTDGSLKNYLIKNLKKFIIQDKKIAQGLENFISHKKKLLLITNSNYEYTNALLKYSINPFLKKYKKWQDLFEYSITSSKKPDFFYTKTPFLKIDPVTKKTHKHNKELVPGIYEAGSSHWLTKALKTNAENILYIGDHIYGDIVRLKKSCSWRTALVVEELSKEIAADKKSLKIDAKIKSLMGIKVSLENEFNKLISDKIKKQFNNTVISKMYLKKYEKQKILFNKKLCTVDEKLSALIKTKQGFYNPYWSDVMRTGTTPSFFANQIEKFACIYMSTIVDFLSLCPRDYLRSEKKDMAHEH